MSKCKTLKEVENRNEQFEHIAELKLLFKINLNLRLFAISQIFIQNIIMKNLTL